MQFDQGWYDQVSLYQQPPYIFQAKTPFVLGTPADSSFETACLIATPRALNALSTCTYYSQCYTK